MAKDFTKILSELGLSSTPTKEELIEKIKSVDWSQIENVKETTGMRFDFTV